MADRKRIYVQWWMVLGGVTFLLLLFNSPWVRMAFPRAHRLKQSVFGLQLEMNFAVWWSAALFLLSAALFYEIASSENRSRRRAYLELSLLMLALVIDEIGSLHERISGFGGWPSLAPFGLVMLALIVDSLRLLWRDRETRPVVWLLLAGFIVLGSVAGQEYAEHNLTSQRWTRLYGHFLEEATELAGGLLILTAAVYGRRRLCAGPLAAAVPDPTRMALLLPVFVFGLIAHVAAAQSLYLPKVGPSRWYGNPAAVYPFVVFLLLACYAFWVPLHRTENGARCPEIRGFWSAVGLFFLACSIGTMQNLWGFVGSLVPGLARKVFYQKTPLYIALILVMWFIGLALWRQRGGRVLWLLALPLAMVLRLYLPHPGRKHLAAGLFACLCAAALLRPGEQAAAEAPPDPASPT